MKVAGQVIRLSLGIILVLVTILGTPSAQAWTQRVNLSVKGRTPDLIGANVDPAGNSVIAWQLTDGTLRPIQARIVGPDGTVGPIRHIAQPGAAPDPPIVDMDSAGTSYFMWTGLDAANRRRARMRTLDPNGVLGPVRTVTPAGEDARAPAFGLDASGNAVVAWGDGTQIRVRTVSVNGVLGPIQDVALLGFWQNRNPQVAVAPNGDAVIAWLEDGNSSHTGAPAGTVWPAGGVWAVRRQSDGTLGEVVDAWVDISLRNPNQLAIDSDGNAAFTWNRDYAGGQVYVRRWPSGRQLAPSQGLGLTNWLPGAPGTESYWGSGMDPSGNVLVVWQGWGGGGMWTSSVAADGTVTETSAPFPMGDNFHIALNAAGDAVIGWRCYRGSRGNTTYVVERAPNGALGPATRLTAGLGRATSPLVDLNDAGRAVAAWISPQDAPRVQISRNP